MTTLTVSSSETLVAAAIAPGYSLSAPMSELYLIVSSPESLIYSVAVNRSNGDKGPATGAQLNDPVGLALDGQGNLHIADYANSLVRKIAAATGIITTVAGNGTLGYSGHGELGHQRGALLSSGGGAG